MTGNGNSLHHNNGNVPYTELNDSHPNQASSDFNGDGKLDMVINNNNATPTIYMNNLKNVGKCIEVKLVGTESNHDAIGARVRLSVAGKTLTRQVEAGSGYASEAMLPLHFGLG